MVTKYVAIALTTDLSFIDPTLNINQTPLVIVISFMVALLQIVVHTIGLLLATVTFGIY